MRGDLAGAAVQHDQTVFALGQNSGRRVWIGLERDVAEPKDDAARPAQAADDFAAGREEDIERAGAAGLRDGDRACRPGGGRWWVVQVDGDVGGQGQFGLAGDWPG